MSSWQDFVKKEGRAPEWPYPLRYDKEQEIETDVLVLGGGITGCWAAINAARRGGLPWWKRQIQSGAVPEGPDATTGKTR